MTPKIEQEPEVKSPQEEVLYIPSVKISKKTSKAPSHHSSRSRSKLMSETLTPCSELQQVFICIKQKMMNMRSTSGA